MPTPNPLVSCAFLIATALAPLPATADINGLLRNVIRDVSTQAVTNGVANSQAKANKAPNSSRQTNSRIQEALNSNGYDAGVADGILGARSRRAIKSYQTANGFNPTGKLTSGQKNRLLGGGAANVLAPVIPALIGGVVDGTLTRKRNRPTQSVSGGGVAPQRNQPANSAGTGTLAKIPAIAPMAPVATNPTASRRATVAGTGTGTGTAIQSKATANRAGTANAARQQRVLQRQNARTNARRAPASNTLQQIQPRQRSSAPTPTQGKNCTRTRTGQICN
ncbi:MAG: peptidoglycan-binding protein [Marinosulfonomonas sp.]|nr:peptidoglycan-binding protein [Marinosulfonomonas sp.]